MNTSRAVGAGPRPWISAWIHHHRQAASDSLTKLLKTPVSTALTLLVVAITLALPATLLIVLDNAYDIAADVDVPARLSLFLSGDMEVEEALLLAENLSARLDIDAADWIDRDAALVQFGKDTGLTNIINSLDYNPLPHTVLVTPSAKLDRERLNGLASSLAALDGVEEVVFDTQWLARMDASLLLVQRLVIGLGVMMAIGAVLILANTTRLAIEARRAEIVVIKLMGGGDAFTRRPFLYAGLWSGIGGGLLATLVVVIFMWVLADPAQALLSLYNSDRNVRGLSFVAALQLILIGGALGLLSAWQATLLHLRSVEPR